MESFLQQVDSETKQPATTVSTFLDDNNNNNNNRLLLRRQQQALSSLAVSLQDVLPILSSLSLSTLQSDHHDSSSSSSVLPNVSAAWLVELCARVPSDLGADYLAHSILLQANQQQQHSDSSSCRMMMEQQQQLFDLLGDSEAAIDVAMQVFPRWKEIRAKIQKSDLLLEKEKRHKGDNGENNNDSEVILVNVQEEQRNYLLEQAREALLLAELAKEQLAERRRQTSGLLTKGTATHFVTRTSDIQLEKQVAKLVKQAAQARQRAKDAGAILDDDDDDVFFKVDATSRGPGGLMKQSTLDLESLQQSLLPSGSKKYYDDKGLPQGTVFTTHEDYEKVVIPAALRNESQLPTRLQISDIMNATFAKAFEGTQSLNPMQSTVFSVAFHGRENVLLCAPTGAGKTNVAMLATVAHFRDVGLIQGSSDDDKESTTVLETGKKVVYIAPMKALAQEVVEKFSSKLKALKLIVRELTGDMQLTRAEAESANVIVTTPEKWDVITRKSGTDELSLGNQCGLLIIDEVHLLADERGAVIESVVSRLHRLVESRQRQLRIVALSATLPNYEDVAEFLQVPERGTFFFGPEHRPVPLEQTLIGISGNSRDRNVKETKMNKICYDIVLDSLRRGFQVMVFVHSRKGTSETARALADLAAAESTLESHFVTAGKEGAAGDAYSRYADKAKKSRDRQVGIHFQNGMGIHHAGMLRGDRKLTENMFTDGAIKVLCCTATLAWGVNLPAHSVIIKGTEVYNPEKGGTVDLSILDVQQIFGRAGRPQFDSFGEATLITNYDAYQRYIEKLVKAVPIESNFIKQLPDHLNAEIVGGTVTNITEAVQWLKYTYLYIRMLRNPLAYGINADEKFADPLLSSRCTELVVAAAKQLDETRMVRFHTGSQNLGATDKGRTAAHFYVRSESVATFTELMANIVPTDADLVRIIASASEFQSMKVRQEELDELEKIARSTPMEIKGAGLDDAGKGLITSAIDKAFIMIQAYISRTKVNGFTLISDINYISANGGRIARALFEMCLKNKEAGPALKLLRIAKSIDNRTWWFQSPLRQFEGEIRENSLFKLEQSAGSNYDGLDYAVSLLDMQPKEVGDMCNWNQGGEKIQSYIMMLPRFDIEYQLLPITEGILKFRVNLTPAFRWHGRWHGNVQSFWIWIENTENERIYYHEQFALTRRNFPAPVMIEATVPTFNATGQYLIKVVSDSWTGVEQVLPVPFDASLIPKQDVITTELQDLTPLPTSVLQNPDYEQLYSFECFNPIQTQLFHVLYHTDTPVLLGAPTGSGKTIIAEIAMLRMKRLRPESICVYIAPLKALARERLKEWQRRLGSPPLNWKVLELSGDTHHDLNILERSDVLVCTPEKWDLLSRQWRGMNTEDVQKEKSFIKRVGLLVLDEVHLLGEDRGAVLEAIVSRTRFISRYTQQTKESTEKDHNETRIIGLSTALANAVDVADWMGIETQALSPRNKRGLYNFKPSVRPVPVKVHVQGYAGKHYCPRMATMNKPCFAAIKDYSPDKPTLIFVASRRQTRLTAFDLISYAAADEKLTSFLNCGGDYIESVVETISDDSLRHTLAFGIGLHHAGLSSADREKVEKLFLEGKILVLVATATLAWGVNLPAHLVIVKGTEYFDGKLSRYVEYPLTDVLQMIGRAGRVGFGDTSAFAVVMATEDKRIFYGKFLYTGFPVESCFQEHLCENINAEIASGTVSSVYEALGYLSWTFYARRVKANPTYYGANSSSDEDVEQFLVDVIKDTLVELKEHGCIAADVNDEASAVSPLPLGIACAKYYLDHKTPKQMQLGVREGRKIVLRCLEEDAASGASISIARSDQTLGPLIQSPRMDEAACAWLLYSLCSTHEFDEHPVRHNEEHLNQELSKSLAWGPDTSSVLFDGNKGHHYHHNLEIFQDPHTKCFLLLQAYLERAKLPISDYRNDTMTVVDNLPRLLAAMEYISLQNDNKNAVGSLELLTQLTRLRQCLATRSLPQRDPLLELLQLPLQQQHKDLPPQLSQLRSLPRKLAMERLKASFSRLSKSTLATALDTIDTLPLLTVQSCRVFQDTTNKATTTTGDIARIGKLELQLHVQSSKTTAMTMGGDLSLTILVGTKCSQSLLLGHASVRVNNKHRPTTIKRTLDFDWYQATATNTYANGGEAAGNGILVRFLWDKVRGMDMEMVVSL